MSRYRTGGTGVSVIGLAPDVSPRETDGRVLTVVLTDLVFAGSGLAFSAWHDGTSMDGADPPTPNWADGDGGFGLWYISPDLFYGCTDTESGIGNEAGMAYRITFRADGATGWAEVDFQIKIPAVGEIIPFYTSGALNVGAKTLTPGDTIVDVTTKLHANSPANVEEWRIYAGDPTMMTGTPTFRIDGSVLKLHWPSVDYTGETIRLYISGKTPDGNWTLNGFAVDIDLTATATADPGPPAGWTIPPYPGEEPEPSGIARPLIDGWGHSRHIDSRMMIR